MKFDEEPKVNELEDSTGSESLSESQEVSKNDTHESGKKSKKISERLSSILKKKAGKQSLIKMISPFLIYASIFIIMLIIIIGIVLFLITMPGMVMEKLKELSRNVGNAFSAFFGGDQTTQIGDEEIYEVLEKLEDMGYYLKGDGFLTDYVGDDEEGVERDENGKIVNAESDFIFTYLASDNYIYTIGNYNQTTTGWIEEYTGLKWVLGRLVAGGQAVWNKISNIIFDDGYKWGKGLIQIYYEEDETVGSVGAYLGSSVKDGIFKWVGAKMNSDDDPPTLEIRRGWGNNTMKYSLDGWSGRYGMPLEFLISVHMATMMPDLAYDMVKTFDTKVEILFRGLEGRAVGAYRTNNGFVTYEQMKDIAGRSINNKEAKQIMDLYGIESPDTCEGVEGIEVGNNEGEDGKKVDFSNENKREEKETELVNTYKSMIDELKQYGYNGSDIPQAITDLSEFDNILLDQEKEEYNTEYKLSKAYKKSISWTGKDEESGEDCVYTAVIELTHERLRTYYLQQGDKIFRPWEEEAKIKWYIKRGFTESEIEEYGEQHKCSDVEDKEECCDACRDFIREIYSKIKDADDQSYKTFQPYIKDVINHWYRNVYFVKEDVDFVKNDYDYQALTKERWTLYETDENGEFVLYKLNGEKFNGTKEQADEQNIPVVKKPVTLGKDEDGEENEEILKEELEDLNWNYKDGIWSAYEVSPGATITQYQLRENNSSDDIDQNIYAAVTTYGNIVQTGEGQRSETNQLIKRMFLENVYLRYDRTSETAEIVNQIRKKLGNGENYYGTIEGINSKGETVELASQNEEMTVTVNGEDKTVRIDDYSGKINLNQDSLNAFSMLENTHTLDADYIYRDFKELVVELGYFEKQDLTDETPRLLQFLVPEIGSYQYPNRGIDKKEQVPASTLIHSKGDIDAYDKSDLLDMVRDMGEDPELIRSNENPSNTVTNDSTISGSTVNGTNITDIVGAVQNNQGAERSCSEVSLDEYLEKAKEIMDYMIENNFRYYSHPGGGGVDALKSEWSDGMSAKNVCCATYVSWVLQELGVMSYHTNSCEGFFPWITEIDGIEVISSFEDLEAGDILFYSDLGQGWVDEAEPSKGAAHVDIFYGWDDAPGGGYTIYSAGKCTGNPCARPCSGGGEDHHEGGWSSSHDTYFAIRLPFNGSKTEGQKYEGYKGNEAVVSPVTGILLEYGTYDDKKINSITGETERVNVDLKYGVQKVEYDEENDDDPVTINVEKTEDVGTIKSEKVGYAKILVLDYENYLKIETAMKSKTNNNEAFGISSSTWNKSFLSNKGNFLDLDDIDKGFKLNEDELEDWSDAQKTLYGYKEFAELYDEFGIAGNVILIDGFKCEMPDEEFDSSNDESKPNGTEIKTSDFEKITPDNFDSSGKLTAGDEDIRDSLYEKDEEVKMASQKATDKTNTESIIKDEAISSLCADDIIVLKEGTVIGRTLTDREVAEDYLNEEYTKYRVDSSNEEDTDKVMGNYLRIAMKQGVASDDSDIENVEDYMKLDDGEEDKKKNEYDWEFFYYVPYESGPVGEEGEVAPFSDQTGGKGAGAAAIASWNSSEMNCGISQWTSISGGSTSNIQGICKWLAEEKGHYSLSKFASVDNASLLGNYSNFQHEWYDIYAADMEEFLNAQMEYTYDYEYIQWEITGENPPDPGYDCSSYNMAWLLDRPMVVQGTFFSCMNYSTSPEKWCPLINSGMSDEEIIDALMDEAANTPSTAGSLAPRFNAQRKLAKDILSGTFTEVENWVRTKSNSEYQEMY